MTLASLLTFPSIQHVPRQTWEEGLLGGTRDRARGECTDIRGGRKRCLPDLAGQAQSNLSVLERRTGMGAGDSARTGRGEGGCERLQIGGHGGQGRDRSCLLPPIGARSSREGLSSWISPEIRSQVLITPDAPTCLTPIGTISAYRITAWLYFFSPKPRPLVDSAPGFRDYQSRKVGGVLGSMGVGVGGWKGEGGKGPYV